MRPAPRMAANEMGSDQINKESERCIHRIVTHNRD